MSSLLAVVSLIVSTPIQSTQPPRSQLEVPAGNLSGRDLTVRYEFIGGQIVFNALLPEGWSFSLNVDGDQNGVWGNGNGTDPALMTNSKDYTYGSTKSGYLCSQYIYTGSADSLSVNASSACSARPSRGHMILGPGAIAEELVSSAVSVPIAEFFGTHSDARIQICIFNTKNWSCNFSPSSLFRIIRPL
ncbi:MAG: hypothetical protein EOO77_06790 [Oxalobacteraceae bacterium]|nr:MAG: hypothetical protein EOO77_06790 [Oxalobacteraceae bacterium]